VGACFPFLPRSTAYAIPTRHRFVVGREGEGELEFLPRSENAPWAIRPWTFLKKKSSVEGGISRGMSTRYNLIAYREASFWLIDDTWHLKKDFIDSLIENIVPYIKCLTKKLSRCVVF